jgi:predicted PurR-regulated permease PerM
MNKKLINITLIALIIYLIYQTSSLWINILCIIKKIVMPIFSAFVIAYIMYTIYLYISKKLNNKISIYITLFIFLGIILLSIFIIIPLLSKQIILLYEEFIKIYSKSKLKNFNLNNYLMPIISNIDTYIVNGFNLAKMSLNIITDTFIVLVISIYFFLDMDKIKYFIKKNLKKNHKMWYLYLKKVDEEMKKYLVGFLKIMIISLFEYGIAYKIINHPNYLLLAYLASILNIIPFFGGILNNVIAALTAILISKDLFIKTIIMFIILSLIDGYIINPLVYKQSNRLHPLITILAVFIFNIIFKYIGLLLALPFTIIIITTYKFLKKYKKIILTHSS